MFKHKRKSSSQSDIPATPYIGCVKLPEVASPTSPSKRIPSPTSPTFVLPNVNIHRSLLQERKDVHPHRYTVFDVSRPTHCIRFQDNKFTSTPISTVHQAKLASSTPQKKVLIKCEDFHPKWTINIRRERGVTCGDIFEEIYGFLRQPLTKQELDEIQPERLSTMKRSFEQRCWEKSVELTEVERRQGMKRVDYLAGKTIFCGLCLAPDVDVLRQDAKVDDCPWLLKLGRPRS